MKGIRIKIVHIQYLDCHFTKRFLCDLLRGTGILDKRIEDRTYPDQPGGGDLSSIMLAAYGAYQHPSKRICV